MRHACLAFPIGKVAQKLSAAAAVASLTERRGIFYRTERLRRAATLQPKDQAGARHSASTADHRPAWTCWLARENVQKERRLWRGNRIRHGRSGKPAPALLPSSAWPERSSAPASRPPDRGRSSEPPGAARAPTAWRSAGRWPNPPRPRARAQPAARRWTLSAFPTPCAMTSVAKATLTVGASAQAAPTIALPTEAARGCC